MNTAHNAAADAVHALNNALQCVRTDPELITNLELGAASDMIGTALVHIGELHALLERQERVIEEMRVETLREKQYSAKVETKNSELVQTVITLTRQLDAANDRAFAPGV